MTHKCIRRFLQDEAGGYTILGIFWFMLFVGIGGLSVDVTDGFRVRTGGIEGESSLQVPRSLPELPAA